MTSGEIIGVVAESFEITPEEIFSRRRPDYIAFPRQLAMSLTVELCGLSRVKVGCIFDRHHGDVIHAIRAVENRIKQSDSVRRKVETIRGRLGANNF